MKSMTGFGKSEAETRFGRVITEARSENHRFLDIKFLLPDSISSIEPELTETVKTLILRGKLRITISIEGTKAAAPVLNIDLARQIRKSIESLKKEMGIREELRLEHFLMIKDIFSTKTSDHLTEADIMDIQRVLSKAIQKLDEARKSEGKKLEKDFRERLDKIDGLTRSIAVKRKDFMESSSAKLRERIAKILEDSQIDEARLY
ncbi:MAG TPA: YicC/YloC family endoribonuclease, partial [Thermodesulfobacteriota bacterium]|nr:YicC/YloC family endoribonuclease [Thermodesulfobacteriota bacterium]